MSDDKVMIERQSNGYTAIYYNDAPPETYVYRNEIEDQLMLLTDIMEHFGWWGSRYDERRIVVRAEPGDKWPGVSADMTEE